MSFNQSSSHRLTFMAAASATNIVVVTFGNKVTWNSSVRKRILMILMKRVTDEKMSQPTDSKAAHRVMYSRNED